MEKKIIAVIGASGTQGGGLVRAILGDPRSAFAVRAITRKLDGDKAKALATLGADVAAADLDDEASLKRAFAGAHGVYAVTNFWEHFSPEKELAQAGNMARAAQGAGVAHVVWSTLEDTRKRVPLGDTRMPTLKGTYKVPHFDAKGEANDLFTKAGVPTTFFHTSFYWENLIHFGMGPRQGADGTLVFSLPLADKKMPGIAAADIGACAYRVFQRGGDLIGRTLGIAGDHPTGAQMAETLSRALGQPVRYTPLSHDAYRKLGFPGADDLGNMFQYYTDFEREFCASRDVALSRSLHPGLLSFSQWADANKGRIPVA